MAGSGVPEIVHVDVRQAGSFFFAALNASLNFVPGLALARSVFN